jgi:hypothetical protein
MRESRNPRGKASRSHAFDWPAFEPTWRFYEPCRVSLRLLRDDFAVLPEVYGRAMHARDFAGGLSSSSHSATNTRGEALRFFGRFAFSRHGPRSSS